MSLLYKLMNDFPITLKTTVVKRSDDVFCDVHLTSDGIVIGETFSKIFPPGVSIYAALSELVRKLLITYPDVQIDDVTGAVTFADARMIGLTPDNLTNTMHRRWYTDGVS